jgi:hypothetical protein
MAASSNGEAPPEFLSRIHLMMHENKFTSNDSQAKAIAAKFGMIYK